MSVVAIYLLFVVAVPGWTYALNHKLPARFYQGEGWRVRLLSCSFCTGTQVAFWGHLLLTAAWVGAHSALPMPLPLWVLVHVCLPPGLGLLAMTIQRVLNLISAVETLTEAEE